MKRGKEEGRNSEPLFPRLNVNDREIGGPRAPPRNKMALYEQLSIPPQRFKSTTSQGYGKNKSSFTSSDAPIVPPSGQLSERTHSQSLDNTTLNTKVIQLGRSFNRQSKNMDVITDGSASNSHHQLISSGGNKYYRRNSENENDNDFTVPTFFQPKVSSVKNSSSSTMNHDENLLKEPSPHSSNENENENENGVRCFAEFDAIDKGDNSWVRNELCTEGDTFNQQTENRATELQENEDVVINDISNESQSGLISGMMICPDDVVGVIGPKHFWKARRAIVNQQRLFAIQVFELHRLIKVQKLIAASPDMVKVDITITPSPNISSPEIFNETLEPATIQKIPFQDLEANSNHTTENSNVQDTPTNMITLNQWCFHPNLNQWLMPIMSPSEGLIYRPYPSSIYMPPFNNHPNQMSFHMSPYSVPYQQPPPMYYPSPYALPFTNPNEQASIQTLPFTNPNEQASIQTLPFTNPNEQASIQNPLLLEKQISDLSCNFSNPVSEVVSGQVQGSSCVNQVLNAADNENRNVVIRVVPHKRLCWPLSRLHGFSGLFKKRGSDAILDLCM